VLVFEERGKPEYQRKPLEARKRTNMMPGPGIEPWTHWWEASTLTTTPTLLL